MKRHGIISVICVVLMSLQSHADVYAEFGIQRTNERFTNSLPDDVRSVVFGKTPIPPMFPFGLGCHPATFGELCSKSVSILIATIAYPPGTVLEGGVTKPRIINVFLEPEEYLLHESEIKGARTYRVSWGRAPEPEAGARVLAFASETGILSGLNRRGIIFLGNQEDDRIIEVVRGYIEHLRGPASDPWAYFFFLHGIMDDPVKRVWMDAKTDLLALVRGFDEDNLRKVMRDASVDVDVRWYAELQKRAKRDGYRRLIRTPSEDVIATYRALTKSDNVTQMREGMRIYSKYGTWFRENPEHWVDVVLPLLKHPDLSIRLSSAQKLTTAGEPAAVPVILEYGFMHESMPSRSSSKYFLEQMLGETIDFDPRAPEDVRLRQIESLKQWWEDNQHRYEK